MSELSPGEQAVLARATVDDPDLLAGVFGAGLLVDLGYEEEAVPRLAQLIAAGEEDRLTGLFYAWFHSDDPSLARRMHVLIGERLLAEVDEFDTVEYRRTLRFLCEGPSAGAFKEQCTREEVSSG